MSERAEMILAARPDTGVIETAWLFASHFGEGHDAIRFNDGPNSAYHSERQIAWQPTLPFQSLEDEMSKIDDTILEALEEAAEYFDNKADVEFDPDWGEIPNREMQILTKLIAALSKAKE